MSAILAVGQEAPNFETIDELGNRVALNDFRGKKVVLYFYPRDDTPGCTKESQGFASTSKQFKEANTVILGVSMDDQASHLNFKEKYDLPFQLLVDTEATISQLYLADTGKGYSRRITYIIDENGIISHSFDTVDTSTHAVDILNILNGSRI